MGRFIKGDVVVTPFPFSDLRGGKNRPALVVAALKGNDVITCMITSQNVRDEDALPLSDKDFATGSLKKESNIRPNRIFTADSTIFLYRIGTLEKEKSAEVINKIIEVFSR
jgi:mRNA interferase MazF